MKLEAEDSFSNVENAEWNLLGGTAQHRGYVSAFHPDVPGLILTSNSFETGVSLKGPSRRSILVS